VVHPENKNGTAGKRGEDNTRNDGGIRSPGPQSGGG